MNKLAIVTMLAVTLIVAGMLLLTPVRQASTVHSTIISSITTVIENTEVELADDAITADTIADAAITSSEAPNLDVAVSSRAEAAQLLDTIEFDFNNDTTTAETCTAGAGVDFLVYASVSNDGGMSRNIDVSDGSDTITYKIPDMETAFIVAGGTGPTSYTFTGSNASVDALFVIMGEDASISCS